MATENQEITGRLASALIECLSGYIIPVHPKILNFEDLRQTLEFGESWSTWGVTHHIPNIFEALESSGLKIVRVDSDKD